MNDRGSALITLYACELRMLVRDRRTVVVSILLPLLVMPLFIFASLWSQRALEKRYQETGFRYALTGSESELVRELLAAAEQASEREKLDRGPVEDEEPALALEEVESADPAADFAAGKLQLYVQTRPAVAAGGAGGPPADSPLAEELALPLLRIVYRANVDESSVAAREMEKRLQAGQRAARAELLAARGFPVAMERVAALETDDVATVEQRSGAALGRFAVLAVLFFLLTGGSVVAADSIAGEKERGTLETLLTTAIRRGEVVAAKQLVILTVGVVIALIQVVNLAVYVGLEVIEVPEGFAVDVSPATLVVLLLLFLPLAALVSSVLLLASGWSKTYKEFQLYFFPIFVLGLALGAAALLPGIELRSAVALLPVANLSVAAREVLTGEIDAPMLLVAWLVSVAAAVLTARFTLRALSTERLITASEIDRSEWQGGPALFPRRVLGWFAVMWVVVFLGATSVPMLQSLSGQLTFNLVVVMLGGSLLMIRRYRLDLRQALALRPVKPVVWLAVVLGAPTFYLTGVATAKLSRVFLPVPERLLEEFARAFQSEALPLWQLLLMVAVLPGICEEIAFRGVLLHGLHRRFRPVVLCLVVSAVFGFFHIDLMRLFPTAFIGLALAAVTLLTGSLYPAMLWHALNNASAIVAGEAGIPVIELDLSVYLVAAVAAALAFVLLWRNRTPYPGLLGSGRPPARIS